MTQKGRYSRGAGPIRVPCARQRCGAWIATFDPVAVTVKPRDGRHGGLEIVHGELVHGRLAVLAKCRRCALVHLLDYQTSTVLMVADRSTGLTFEQYPGPDWGGPGILPGLDEFYVLDDCDRCALVHLRDFDDDDFVRLSDHVHYFDDDA